MTDRELVALSRWTGEPDRDHGTAGAQRQFWDGTLHVSGAPLSDVRPVGLQSPDDRIVSDEQGFRFRTATAGNDMGCTFTVEATADATFRVATEPASFDASLSQIRAKTLIVEAGGLERRLELGPAPAADSSHLVSNASYSGQAEFFRASRIRRHESWRCRACLLGSSHLGRSTPSLE